jgi:hypothetical protein
MADWVGHVAWWVMPIAQMIGADVIDAPVIHTDDTPIKMLAPGHGKTRLGHIWVYLVDEKPWQGTRPTAAYYRFSPDRKGERPRDHLAAFRGVIQADAFSGYEAIARQAGPPGANAPPIIHAACMAHARRKLFDEFERTKSPIAEEALKRIGELYRIETEITGMSEDQRLSARQQRAVPILAELKLFFEAQHRRLSSKSGLAKALRYSLNRWDALTLYTKDGRIGIDNNPAERSLRTIALTRQKVQEYSRQPDDHGHLRYWTIGSGQSTEPFDGCSNSHSGIGAPLWCASEGDLILPADLGLRRVHILAPGFPRPALGALADADRRSMLRGSFRIISCGDRRAHLRGNRPDEADELSRYRRDRDLASLTAQDEATVARRQA